MPQRKQNKTDGNGRSPKEDGHHHRNIVIIVACISSSVGPCPLLPQQSSPLFCQFRANDADDDAYDVAYHGAAAATASHANFTTVATAVSPPAAIQRALRRRSQGEYESIPPAGSVESFACRGATTTRGQYCRTSYHHGVTRSLYVFDIFGDLSSHGWWDLREGCWRGVRG